MKITFLIGNATGMGGTIRTTITLANHLARRHDVEVLSVKNTRAAPFFELSADVRLRMLVDTVSPRPTGVRARLDREERLRRATESLPSRLVHPTEKYASSYSAYSDRLLVRALTQLDADIIVGTRAYLSRIVSQYAPSEIVRIAWEHVPQRSFNRRALAAQLKAFPKLDAIVTLTEVDRRAHAAALGEAAPPVVRIVNALPDVPRRISDGSRPLVVTAGRLVPVKRYGLLLKAFASVVESRPDWELRLYGAGVKESDLRATIFELGLYNNAFLMGRTNRLEEELAKASIATMTSSLEGFPMIIMEAMSHGLPVVSFDCPNGPAEMIAPGVDGELVPFRDVPGFARSLLGLIEDDERRRSYGQAALTRAKQYDVETVSSQWEDLFERLQADKRARRRASAR